MCAQSKHYEAGGWTLSEVLILDVCEFVCVCVYVRVCVCVRNIVHFATFVEKQSCNVRHEARI